MRYAHEPTPLFPESVIGDLDFHGCGARIFRIILDKLLQRVHAAAVPPYQQSHDCSYDHAQEAGEQSLLVD
jgi:hypothetical protein